MATRNYTEPRRYDDDDNEGHPTLKDYEENQKKRKEKRLKNALRSKNFAALLDEDDDEYDI